MITIATNLIVRPSSSSSTHQATDPVTKLSHVSHNRFDIPMQQQPPQEQLEHYYTHAPLNSSELDLDMNNMTSLDAGNMLYQHDQSFNYSQVMTNYSKNWSERILQDITGLLHVLSPTGKILYCSSSCISVVGFQPEELVGRSLTDFIHVDDLDLFIQNFQLAFSSMSRIKIHYRLRCKDNSFVLLESIGHPKQDVMNEPAQYFFAIAQPYLSRSNGLMESFLEMRLENEWLKKRLEGFLNMNHSPPISAVEPACSQLQMNLQQPQQQQYHLEQHPYTFYNDTYNTNDQHHPQQLQQQQQQQQQLQQRLHHQQLHHHHQQQQQYLSHQQQQQHHHPYPQQQPHQQPQQQTQITQSSRRPSTVSAMMDEQWNYSPSVASSTDLMTRYQAEEANGLTTAAATTTSTTPSTTTNTATSIASTSTLTMPMKTTATTTPFPSSDNTLMIPPDVARKEKWKRRKKQASVEYHCTDCGTTSSPEWRKGPAGAKSLCNACGLRWAKKNKKI